MPDHNDSERTERRYSVPGLAGGFVPVPKDVLFDPTLSSPAKLAYAILLEFAWRAGSDDEAEPEIEELSAAIGVGRTTALKAIRELAAAGLVVSKRRGQGRPNAYLMLLVAHDKKSGFRTSRSPESDSPRARAGDQTTSDELPDRRSSTAPTKRKSDPVFEALAEACGVDWHNDKDGAKEVGIAVAQIRRLADAEDESIELEIPERVAMYRRVMRDAILTPRALAKWWLRLPKLDQARSRGVAVSADDLMAEARAEWQADQDEQAHGLGEVDGSADLEIEAEDDGG